MGRPASKGALLAAATEEFNRLWEAVEQVPVESRELPGACADWSVKDLLAHLHAWQEMTLEWERAGSAGLAPAIPAAGYTFADTPALNQAIYERTRDNAWSDVISALRASHDQLLLVIDAYSAEDLFTKRRYPWTRSTSVGAYLVSSTSSHYAWAAKLIRAWARTC